MSKHTVTVHQLKSDSGDSLFNVDAQMGSVLLSTVTFERPTYILIDGIHLAVVQFDTDEWADEWFMEHVKRYETVYRVSDGKLLKVF